jgi:hypothetical protein
MWLGSAAHVEHALRLEDLLDQRRVAALDLAPGLDVVPVRVLAPVVEEVLLVVMLRLDGLLRHDAVLEALDRLLVRIVRSGGVAHRCSLACDRNASRSRVEESVTVSR